MIVIEVTGRPAPQGSKRHVGNGRMIEMSKAVGPWREAVRAQTSLHCPQPIAGAVSCRIIFRMPRPKGHYGTGRNAGKLKLTAPRFPTGKPDIDKLERAVLDGLTEGGAWKDDSQVVCVVKWKIYAPEGMAPGCRIELKELELR